MQSYGARLFGTLSKFPQPLCQISALKEAIGEYVYEITIFLKWGILNVPFCSIFVSFHFYLIMTLVVPCLHNMFMVLLNFEVGNFKIGATKPCSSDEFELRFARGGGVPRNRAMNDSVLYRAMLPNYLRAYSSALCQIRALEKAFKKQNYGQSVPKIWF